MVARASRWWILLLACWVWGAVSAQAQLAMPRTTPVKLDGLVVIGNVEGVQRLDPSEVRRVFRGEQSLWRGGIAVTVVLPSPRSAFIETVSTGVFGLSKAAMQRYWLGLVFQGRAAPPVQLETADEMIAFVRRTPGAIAIVPAPIAEAARSLVISVP